MLVIIMNNNQKRGLLSIPAGVALLILMAGIFLENVSFMDALFVAVSLWILTGVGSRFIGVRRSGRIVPNAGWRRGLVALLSSIGVIILLAGMMLNVASFNVTFVIAMGFWIVSGILARFLGVSKRNRYYNQYPKQVDTSYFPPYPPANPYPPASPSPPVAPIPQPAPKPYYKSTYNTDGPAKSFCPKCGSTMQKEDTFCSNCGSSMHI